MPHRRSGMSTSIAFDRQMLQTRRHLRPWPHRAGHVQGLTRGPVGGQPTGVGAFLIVEAKIRPQVADEAGQLGRDAAGKA
jgi:hypothetical protein